MGLQFLIGQVTKMTEDQQMDMVFKFNILEFLKAVCGSKVKNKS